MRSGGLLDGGAAEYEARQYPSGGDVAAVAFLIPGSPKGTEEDAGNRGMSFSALVRTSMMEELARRRSQWSI